MMASTYLFLVSTKFCVVDTISSDINIVATCWRDNKISVKCLEIVWKNNQKLFFAKCVFSCLLFGVKVLVSTFVRYCLLFGSVGLQDVILEYFNTPRFSIYDDHRAASVVRRKYYFCHGNPGSKHIFCLNMWWYSTSR